MNAVQTMAVETLKAARETIVRARRRLFTAIGVLALMHLLIIAPYLDAVGQMQDLKPKITVTTTLIQEIDPRIKELRETEEASSEKVAELLEAATKDMIGDFAVLKRMIRKALTAGPDVVREPFADTGNSARQPEGRNQLFGSADERPGPAFDTKLDGILQALAGREPDTGDQLKNWAHKNIVAPTYAGVQKRWEEQIRPNYLKALDEAETGARGIAEKLAAIESDKIDTETAAAMTAAADELGIQRTLIAGLDIAPSRTEAVPVAPDFWETVEGKHDYAQEISEAVSQRLRALTEAAQGMPDPLHKTLELQEKLRSDLLTRQNDLKDQFKQQQKRLTSLTGTSDLLPLDLAGFVALFPLIVGLVLGLILLSWAGARREAAEASAGLDPQEVDEGRLSAWLIRRALGEGGGRGAAEAAALLAIGAIVWVIFSARQVGGVVEELPMPTVFMAGIGVLTITVACVWDLMAIRRLTLELHRLPHGRASGTKTFV
jgi:hypothetical protein